MNAPACWNAARLHLERAHSATDKWLWRRGVRSELPRRALAILLGLTALSAVLGLALLPFTVQVAACALGLLAATVNLYALSKSVGKVVGQSAQAGEAAGAGGRLLANFGSLLRLAATVLLIFLLIRVEQRAVFGLLAGFTGAMFVLALCGLKLRSSIRQG